MVNWVYSLLFTQQTNMFKWEKGNNRPHIQQNKVGSETALLRWAMCLKPIYALC